MTRSEIFKELLKLPEKERLQIAEDLWETIGDKDLPLTDAQGAELDRRMAELERDPSKGLSLEEVRAHLRERFG